MTDFSLKFLKFTITIIIYVYIKCKKSNFAMNKKNCMNKKNK